MAHLKHQRSGRSFRKYTKRHLGQNSERKEPHEKEGICEYHQCKKRGHVYRCDLCGKYFCELHSEPKPVSMPNFKNDSVEARLLREEWVRNDGHPCVPFLEYWKRKRELQSERWGRTLDLLNGAQKKTYDQDVQKVKNYRNYAKEELDDDLEPISYEQKFHSDYKKNPKKYYKLKDKNRSNHLLWIIFIIVLAIVLLLIIMLGLGLFGSFQKCIDGTRYNSCSSNKPYYCFNGSLVEKAQECGCPNDYKLIGDACQKIQRCNDTYKTEYGGCSNEKPYYCSYSGEILELASGCGCPNGYFIEGQRCVSLYERNPKNVNLDHFSFTVYGGLNDYLGSLPRSISYYYNPPTTRDFILRDLNNEIQKPYLMELVSKIKDKYPSKDRQAEIAIDIVQNIPYDWDAFETDSVSGRYPYEVLYDQKGVCGEKSELMAFLLRELGFGVAIFEFTEENHRAVGILCDSGDYGTNYCFIESSDVYPIGSIPPKYVGGIDIRRAVPEVIIISEGDSYN